MSDSTMINDDTLIRTALIGYPVKHSKSPLMHKYWFDQYEINGMYEAISIAPEDLKEGVQHLIDKGYKGFNVTIPHKINILPFCDTVDAIARAINAVNTVTIKDGKLHGANTDAYGFIENIKQNAPDFDFEKGKAVILGAGGAAQAIIYALLHEKVPEIVISNRTKERAEKLQEFNIDKITIVDWEDRHNVLEDANIIINATSLGMDENPALNLNLSKAPKTALVTDIVYAPLMTNLLDQAQHKGMPFVTGIGMLMHQAIPGFKRWNGIMPEVTEELEEIMLK